MTEQQPAPKRKKSQKRQRSEQIKTPLTKDEFNGVARRAAALGLSKAAFSRLKMLDETGERSLRRLPVDALLLRQALAQMGKIGSNMNQIAYQLNAHGADAPVFKSAAEGRGAKGLTADFRQALAEWAEVRDLMLEALGHAPPDKKPAVQPSKFISPRK